MAFANDFAQTLKQQADIVRIVGGYISLRKSGAQNYSGLCPFHKEKSPSFSVHAARQFYHCFGCQASGDVFSFVQKIENITFPEAVRAVAQKLGVPMPKQAFSTEAEAKDARLRTALLEIHERACVFFQECLRRPEGARAREYLAGRGLNEDTIRQFRIGFAPDSGFILRDRLKSEFSEEVLRESGLFSWKDSHQPSAVSPQLGTIPETNNVGTGVHARPAEQGSAISAMYSKFRNRVMFPIANESGRVIAFTGRTLATDEKSGPKYLNSPETAIYSKSRVLFNLHQAKDAIRALNYVILVEGQMDCISVFSAGFHNVIASSGTAFTAAQAALLARFSKQALVNFDPDAAGAKATERTLGLLIEEEFDIRVLTLDAGLDPDLFVRRKGKDAYTAALKNSQKYFDYLIERARQQFPVRSAEGKHKALNYLLPHIQRVPSRIIRDSVAEEIAQKLNIDSQVLRQELKYAAVSRKSATVKPPTEAQVTDAEKILIRALASESQFQNEDYLSDRSGADDAFEPARQAKYVLSSERLHVGLGTESLIEMLLNPAPDIGVMDIPLSDSDRQLLAAILLRDDEELTAEKVEGATRALRRVQIRRRLEQIQKQLETFRSSDGNQLKDLMDEKLRLKKILMDPNLGAGGNLATPA
ncbi:MAG TPA: DNA primase [Terriglobales bacterium]|nr:DNA primase [Terriglobales bacterium]